MRVVLKSEATACCGKFVDKKNNMGISNARAAGDLYGGSGVVAPAGTGWDPFCTMFCDWYVRWFAAPFRRMLMSPLQASPGGGGRGSWTSRAVPLPIFLRP